MSHGDEEPLPRDFGKYRLTRRIATGGTAEIFLAHRHDAPLEPLVIKRILPHLTEASGFVSMFLEEASLAADLAHPNVVRIDELGQVEGQYFLAMEYIHGEDVRAIYNQAFRLQRSLPLSHSVQIIADAARGLAHAHRVENPSGEPLGLVHRDVSPQNIIVTFDGHAKVIDFGIARAAHRVEQTRSGILKGKYSYLSPEQALGDPLDHRTDLFALGIILFETTTGTRLFKRSTELATLQAIIKCDHARPSEALAGYPMDLEAIVLQTLHRNPDDRPRDGDQLAEALESFLDRSGLRASRATIAHFMADLFQERLQEEDTTGDFGSERPLSEGDGASRPASMPPRASLPPPASLPPRAASLPPRAIQARVETEVGPRRRRAQDNDGEGKGEEETPAKTQWDQPSLRPELNPAPAYDGGETEVPGARASLPKWERSEDESSQEAPSEGISDWTRRILKQRQGQVPAEDIDEDLVVPRDSVPYVVLAIAAALLGLALGLGGLLWGQSGGGPSPAEVTVLTEPGAEVYVDGAALGRAGPEGRAGPFLLSEGAREVRVTQTDLRFDRVRSVEVVSGRTYETEIRARKGFLKLRVAPWAEVSVDGRSVGLTPLPRIPLYEGVHQVELVNPDLGVRRVVTARVLADEETMVEMRLQKGPADRR